MNIRRKFLRMVDLRVHHYFVGRKSIGASHLGRVHPIESLAHDSSDAKTFSLAEKSAEPMSL
jgi:hypothetical protein